MKGLMELMTIAPIISLGIVIIVNLLLAYEFNDIAKAKGYEEKKYFWYCFLFGIAGQLLVIALPNKNK